MVKARRITEITVQTEEAFVLHRSSGSPHASCAQCGTAAPMVTPEEAAVVFGVAVRTIYREIEAGELHFEETAAGSVLVCLHSLRQTASLGSPDTSPQTKKTTKEIQS